MLELTNFESKLFQSDEPVAIEQTFSYTHLWKMDNVTDIQKRSGNPGYQMGKPVLTGLLKFNDSGDNWFIERGNDPNLAFLNIMSPSPEGDCNFGKADKRCIVQIL